MNAWDVFRNGRWIDRVFYTRDCDADRVRRSLVDHDGLPADITVCPANNRPIPRHKPEPRR